MVPKWTGSGLEVTGSGAEVGQKWTGSVHLSVCTSVHPKHFLYLLDEPNARDLQAQGACPLRFQSYNHNIDLKSIPKLSLSQVTPKKFEFLVLVFVKCLYLYLSLLWLY